jgi:hypothetical protein
MGMCRELEIITEIRKARLQRLGHVERMPEERAVRNCLRIFEKEEDPLENQETAGRC